MLQFRLPSKRINKWMHRSSVRYGLHRAKEFVRAFVIALFTTVFASQVHCQDAMERIVVAPDGSGFQTSESHTRFMPWGFNYDHDEQGRLIEEYWDQEWETIEDDFREMKALGANIVRIHLQVGAFLSSKDSANPQALRQLQQLIELAEREGLYLDLTGLGCYDKSAVPEWYDALTEKDRWKAQEVFWEAIARVGAKSNAVFCYDLMNEPVSPGGDTPRTDWLGPDFAGKYFTQFIALDRAERDRASIASDWIHGLVAAIRRHDTKHLITVGLVPWSLDRPGLTSGFVPDRIASELDFIAVHIYPEQGKRQESIELLKGFAAAGKPVIIEEVFPLQCNANELREFMQDANGIAQGWIGFYWGTTVEEYRRGPQSLATALTLAWLELFQKGPPQDQESPKVGPISK